MMRAKVLIISGLLVVSTLLLTLGAKSTTAQNTNGASNPTASIPISVESDLQTKPELVTDGLGGAIITWQDLRFGGFESDVYAQRVDSNGNVFWANNGVPISRAANKQTNGSAPLNLHLFFRF